MPGTSTRRWSSRAASAAVVLAGLVLGSALRLAHGQGTSPPPAAPAGGDVSQAGARGSESEYREALVEVRLNEQTLDDALLLFDIRRERWLVPVDELAKWRLRIPSEVPVVVRGKSYLPLDALPGVRAKVDEQTQSLALEAAPNAFVETEISASSFVPRMPQPPGTGGFLNYDLFYSHAPGFTQTSALGELGVFNRYGVGTLLLLAQDAPDDRRVTRLDATWRVDDPARMRTLILGDTVSVPGAWGRSLRFGGIQYGTNFALQPGFSRFPVQRIAGEAVVPSTVDVFVNNALVSQTSVTPGPFAVNNIPIVSGTGDVQVVVRDVFGRQQVVTQPFYGSTQLLRPGVADFAVEAGFVRENYALKSNDYGDWFTAGTYRHGITDRFTGEVRGETSQRSTAAGAGGDYLVGPLGTFTAYGAASHSDLGVGGLGVLGFQRVATPWNFTARGLWTTDKFAQIGLLPLRSVPLRPGFPPPVVLPPAIEGGTDLVTAAPIFLGAASVGYSAGRWGSIGVGVASQRNRIGPDLDVLSVSYGVSLGRAGWLNLSAVHTRALENATTFLATLTIPLGGRTFASVQGQALRRYSDVDTSWAATLQQSPPFGEGWGYRLVARDNGSAEAGAIVQTRVATLAADVARFQGSEAYRANVSGGVAFLDGGAFLTRRVTDGFAVVSVGGFPNVRVQQDNQLIGRTDASGRILLPRIRPYDANVIGIESRDLPLDVEIEELQQTAVPYFRSGVKVDFPARRSRGALITLRLPDGKPVPVGAEVVVAGRKEAFPVARDGEAFVTGLDARNELRATWNGGACVVSVEFAPSADPVPRLGPFTCQPSP